jgi:hypothetical protein
MSQRVEQMSSQPPAHGQVRFVSKFDFLVLDNILPAYYASRNPFFVRNMMEYGR